MTRTLAPDSSTFVFGQARFQWLTPRLVRMEWQENGRFEDRKTLAVVNRAFEPVRVTRKVTDKTLVLKSKSMTLTYTDDGQPFHAGNLDVRFAFKNKTARWLPGQENDGNLGATIRTLDGVNGSMDDVAVPNPLYKKGAFGQQSRKYLRVMCELDLGKGLISKDGWSILDDSQNIAIDKVQDSEWVSPRPDGERRDWYFFGYGHDYESALKDGTNLLGRQPLPPRFAFGYWWSRWWAYTDQELEGLVKNFDTMDIPIDVLVVDMDWHLPGWTGYTWDRNNFPDPDDFLARLKEQGLKVTLNLHPADGVGKHEAQFPAMAKAMGVNPKKAEKVEFDITDPKYMKHYFEMLHHPEENRGIDFWWMDWQQGSSSKIPGLDTLPWINHLHWQDMAKNKARKGKRPLIFSRYGGPGAGRYNIGFSGDTHSTWESLAYQPYFTATASNILFGYWSHDIGGFKPGPIEPELYTRWMQYGLYAPILRTHTNRNAESERRVWQYPAPYSQLMMDAIRKRYAMVPYIYTECRKTFETGVSLCRPMYYEYPEAKSAYKAKGQYMFGSQMLVAPVVSKRDEQTGLASVKVWLPEGEWFDTARGCSEHGGGWITREYLLSEVPTFVRPGTMIPEQQNVRRLNGPSITDLKVTIYPGKTGDYALYEDDGITCGYEKDDCVHIAMRHQTRGGIKTITIDPVVGSYKGFTAKKNIEIRLPGSVPPKAIRLGRKTLDWSYRARNNAWWYDGDEAAVCIRLDAVDLREGLSLAVDNVQGRPVNGLRGILARLEQLRILSIRALPTDERIGIEMAQMGNRVSRNPSTLQSEWAGLLQRFHQAAPIFRALKKSKDKKQNEARVQNGDKALAIIKHLVKSGLMNE